MPGLVLLTPPAAEPLTLAETKTHLRVEHTADDTLISALISAARQACEQATGRALITQTLQLWLNFPYDDYIITLPRPPLLSVSSISTFDDNDVEATYSASNYRVDAVRQPGQVILKDGASLPGGRTVNGIKVQYTAGYGPAGADVPMALRQGMLAHVAALYEKRGDDASAEGLPAESRQLYHPYKIMVVL